MDEQITKQIEQLSDDLLHAVDAVSSALESGDENRELEAGALVPPLVQRYRAIEQIVAPHDRGVLERGLGRRITDLRRQAADLTQRQQGHVATRAIDAGMVPFVEQRAYRVAPQAAHVGRQAEKPRYTVGGDVDSWCSKCGGMHEHRIVALVDGQPKHVICQACFTKHSFRAKQPEKKAAVVTKHKGPPRAEDVAIDRERAAKRALQKELAEASEVKPFDPKGRYKAGEVIEHTLHGRGKIENVLKGSLLVRFMVGLKPLNLS